MGQLNGKIALITGGTSGIGLATAQRFVAEGAKVIVTGRNAEKVAATQELLGDSALAVQSDASDLDAIDGLVETIKGRFDRVDAVFLNAGVVHFTPLEGETKAGFEKLFDINVLGPYFAAQKLLPLLAPGSALLFNTSVVNIKGIPGASLYAATKAALRSITRTLAAELAPRGIRVNAVSPGPVETPIYGTLGMPAEQLDAFATQMTANVPLRRFGRADELANAALFLLSDQGSYVTGAELAVDGGYTQV